MGGKRERAASSAIPIDCILTTQWSLTLFVTTRTYRKERGGGRQIE